MEAKHGTCAGDLPPLDTLRWAIALHCGCPGYKEEEPEPDISLQGKSLEMCFFHFSIWDAGNPSRVHWRLLIILFSGSLWRKQTGPSMFNINTSILKSDSSHYEKIIFSPQNDYFTPSLDTKYENTFEENLQNTKLFAQFEIGFAQWSLASLPNLTVCSLRWTLSGAHNHAGDWVIFNWSWSLLRWALSQAHQRTQWCPVGQNRDVNDVGNQYWLPS